MNNTLDGTLKPGVQEVRDAGRVAFQTIARLQRTAGNTQSQWFLRTANSALTIALRSNDISTSVQDNLHGVDTATHTVIAFMTSTTAHTTTVIATTIGQGVASTTQGITYGITTAAQEVRDGAVYTAQGITYGITTTAQGVTHTGVEGFVAIRNSVQKGFSFGTKTTSKIATTLLPKPQAPAVAHTVSQTEMRRRTTLHKDETGKTIIASLSLSVFDSFGAPSVNTPVVLFSTPKIALTNSGGIATFHDVETGKHQLEIHVKDGTVEKRDFILEPSVDMPTEYKKELNVVLPVIQVMVSNPNGTTSAPSGVPAYAWAIIGLLALSNMMWVMMMVQRKRDTGILKE